jgi:hypothetical protein
VIAAALSMSVQDFVELQKLSPADLRTRFRLPASCEPSLAALTTDSTARQITVAVDCRPGPVESAPVSEPASMPSRPPSRKDAGK